MPCVSKLAPIRNQPSGSVAASDRCHPVRPARPVQGRKRVRRLSVILGVGATATLLSVGVAAAASQGTRTGGLNAGSAVAAPCGSGITASYMAAFSASTTGYSVSQVSLANIPTGCLNRSYRIQLTGGSGAAVGSEMTGMLPASGTTANIATSGAVDASLVTGISVVIS